MEQNNHSLQHVLVKYRPTAYKSNKSVFENQNFFNLYFFSYYDIKYQKYENLIIINKM